MSFLLDLITPFFRFGGKEDLLFSPAPIYTLRIS